MNIIEKPINEVIPYEKNPRINDNAVPAVMKSIEEFGFKVPIVIDKNGTIVTGHTRLKAAKKLGMKTVPCIVADDLTSEQIKAFRLADNKVAEAAEWEQSLLLEELQGIVDIDMSDFGFMEETESIEGPDDTYTKDINIPQYEPTGENVTLENCLDNSKTTELIWKINESHISEDEKQFLRSAAHRHNQFNYKKIAEYYANNASPEMQELMEQSALVIIDYDDAIRNGYVQLSSSLEAILSEEETENE